MHLYNGSEQLMLNPRNKVWEQCAPPCQHTCCWSHQIHDGWIGTLGVDCDLLSQRVFYHHWHPLSCGVKPQCVQKLKAQLAQVWKLHGHLIWQTTDKSTVIGPGSINQRCLVWWLCLKSELAFILSQSFCFIKAGWDGAEGMLQVMLRTLLLIQLCERALGRGGGQHAAAHFMGGRAVGGQTGGAAAVGARGQAARSEALDEVLDGLYWRLQLVATHLDKTQRTFVKTKLLKYLCAFNTAANWEDDL